MFQIIIVMLKCRAGIVRRIDIDTLYLSGKLALQRFQCQQIIPMDQHILRIRVGGGVGKLRVFNQQTRLDSNRLVLAVPGQFQLAIIYPPRFRKGAFRTAQPVSSPEI